MTEVGFVLVHGGGHDSRCWDRLVPLLDGPVTAVDLPGRGTRPANLTTLSIADFVRAVVEDIDAFGDVDRVVLVGHSMAGITIPYVAEQRPTKVAHLVFVSCFVPREGSSITGELPAWLRVISRLPRRSSAGGMRPSVAKYMFCNDMDAAQRAFTLERLVPETQNVLSEPVSRRQLPAPDVIPRTYVKLLRDHSLRPRRQDEFIRNVGGCQVRELDSGHDAMISHPRELAAILNELRG